MFNHFYSSSSSEDAFRLFMNFFQRKREYLYQATQCYLQIAD